MRRLAETERLRASEEDNATNQFAAAEQRKSYSDSRKYHLHSLIMTHVPGGSSGAGELKRRISLEDWS